LRAPNTNCASVSDETVGLGGYMTLLMPSRLQTKEANGMSPDSYLIEAKNWLGGCQLALAACIA
jgi:hypothetical protein